MLIVCTMFKRNKKSKAKSKRKSSRTPSARIIGTAAVLLVVVIVGVGFLSWSRSPLGRANLLRMGVDKYRSTVLETIDAALAAALPVYVAGDAVILAQSADPDFAEFALDWSDSTQGPGAVIRCRVVALPVEMSFWEAQSAVVESITKVGGQVLWSERLHMRDDGISDDTDLLRMDLGVAGHPTHTIVLSRLPRPSRGFRWGEALPPPTIEELLGDKSIPTVAIVVDDWGNYDNDNTRGLLHLDVPLTMSVLPDLPHSRRFALCATELALPDLTNSPLGRLDSDPANGATVAQMRAELANPVKISTSTRRVRPIKRRREVILHLPMEPQKYPENNPGEPFIRVGMSKRDIEDVLDQALRLMPGVKGLNNHMGSAATADTETMRSLMKCLKERDLFFLDSLTTSRSVAAEEALRAGVPELRSWMFLDQSETSRKQVRELLDRLIRRARATGMAVGICHPYPETVAILCEELPKLQREGIRFVTISEMIALQASD